MTIGVGTNTDESNTSIEAVLDADRSRLVRLDPLARATGSLDTTTPIATAERRGRLAAVALHRLDTVDPTAPEAAWGPDTAHQISLHSVEAPMRLADRVLTDVEEYLAKVETPDHTPVRISVAAPDMGWSRALLARRFSPVSVVAARPARPRDAAPPPHLSFVRLRTATVDDLEAMLPLAAAVQRFDATTGAVPERPSPADLLRPTLEHDLTRHPGWAWVAERGGSLVGLCTLTPPPASDWATRFVTAPRVGYLGLLYVEPSLRHTRVGSALAARAHRRAADDPLEATVLHHNPLNPLATAFWNRQGYRPVHIVWQR